MDRGLSFREAQEALIRKARLAEETRPIKTRSQSGQHEFVRHDIQKAFGTKIKENQKKYELKEVK